MSNNLPDSFQILDKPENNSLSDTDAFLLQSPNNYDETMQSSSLNIWNYIKSKLSTVANVFDHKNLSNIGSNTHDQIDVFISSADTTFATYEQGQKADTALQPNGDGSGLSGITKIQIGLDKVDNTADVDKPISTSMQMALDLKENITLPSSIIYIDSNRLDTYDSDGTISRPYKNVTEAILDIGESISNLCMFLYSGTYAEPTSSITFPSVPISIIGNNSSISTNLLFNNSNVKISDLSISGNISFDGSTSRLIIDDCNVNGSIISDGITKIYNSFITSSDSEYVVDSTGGSLTIIGSNIIGSTNGVHISNTSINSITESKIDVPATKYAIVSGESQVYVSNIISSYGAISGSAVSGYPINYISSYKINVGSDAPGDIYYRNTNEKLDRVNIGASGTILYSDGSKPEWSELNCDKISDGINSHLISTSQLAIISSTSGVNTGDQTDISGNAATATKLKNTIKINGVDFDGSSDITIGSSSASSNEMLEVDITNGDIYIDTTNYLYSGYIINGSPTVARSIFITVKNRYYKIINNITTDVAIYVESGE